MKRMRSTQKGSHGKGGCFCTLLLHKVNPSSIEISSSTYASTQFLPTNDPRSIPSLNQLSVCSGSSSSQIGSISNATYGTLAQPPAQLVIKLSKLVKKARYLGCKTFLGTMDAVAAKNWLKRVLNTLTDMELDDELKLKVATRLIDKSTATQWDNLKFRATTLVIWDIFLQEFNEQYYTHFHRDQKR